MATDIAIRWLLVSFRVAPEQAENPNHPDVHWKRVFPPELVSCCGGSFGGQSLNVFAPKLESLSDFLGIAVAQVHCQGRPTTIGRQRDAPARAALCGYLGLDKFQKKFLLHIVDRPRPKMTKKRLAEETGTSGGCDAAPNF